MNKKGAGMNNKRFGDNKQAFTLAEMMVVMLIMTIMLAAFAPLMTKKKTVDFNSTPWLFAQDNSGDIYYGLSGKQTAMIGQKQQANNDPESKLLINSGSDSNYAIVFKDQGDFAGGLAFDKEHNLFLDAIDESFEAGMSTPNTKFQRNIAIGASSMLNINKTTSAAKDNISVGTLAMKNIKGSVLNNIAIGSGALSGSENNTNQFQDNVAIGRMALASNVNGSTNVAIGSGALTNNTTGQANTAIGYSACQYVTAGSNKTCIGAYSGPSNGANTASDNSKVIYLGDSSTTVYIPGTLQVGNRFLVDGNNFVMRFGNTAYTLSRNSYGGGLSASNASSINDSIYSDKRLKNIKGDNKSGLDKVRELKVFDYTFKNDKDKTPHVGVIAQDLQKVFPDAVKEDKQTGFLKIRKEDMFYAVVNAVKELDNFVQGIINELKVVYEKINNHDAQIKALQQENQELKARIDKLEKLIESK